MSLRSSQGYVVALNCVEMSLRSSQGYIVSLISVQMSLKAHQCYDFSLNSFEIALNSSPVYIFLLLYSNFVPQCHLDRSNVTLSFIRRSIMSLRKNPCEFNTY